MRALIFLTILLPFSAMADDGCHIDSKIWYTTGYPEQDSALCVQEWAVFDIRNTPLFGDSDDSKVCQVTVELIGEDDIRLDTLVRRADRKEQIYHAGRWFIMMYFENKILAEGCKFPASS